MPLENVIEDIISQANSTAQTILKEAEEEAEKILSKEFVDSKRKVGSFEEETRELIEERKNSELMSARIEQRRMVLAAKKLADDKIFDAIKQRLSKVSEKEREGIIKSLVERAKKELSHAKYIYSNSADRKIAEKAGLEFAGTINCLGGVIVENSDKSVRMNLTFDRLFEDFKEEVSDELGKVFG